MMNAYCVAVDWGTSSFRLWVLGPNGQVLADRRSGQGMNGLQPTEFAGVLESSLQEIGLPEDLPTVICGMAGAAQGWMPAPYIDLPASLADIARLAVRVPSSRRDIRILPGLAQRDPSCPDVMRGEETLLLGALRSGLSNGTVCLPGTHCKWVLLREGIVTAFSTAMTGELFSLLSKQSTLRHALIGIDRVDAEQPSFEQAVEQSLENPQDISTALFSVRAAALFEQASGEAAAARLSGLLIGLEIAGMRSRFDNAISLVANGRIADVYTKALSIAGFESTLLDGEDLVRAGLFASARHLWPQPDETRNSV